MLAPHPINSIRNPLKARNTFKVGNPLKAMNPLKFRNPLKVKADGKFSFKKLMFFL